MVKVSVKVFNAKLLRTVKAFIESGQLNNLERDQWAMCESITHAVCIARRVLVQNFEINKYTYHSNFTGWVDERTVITGAALSEAVHSMMLSLIKGGAGFSYYSDCHRGPRDIEFVAHVILKRFYIFESEYESKFDSMKKSSYPSEDTRVKVGEG